MTPRTRRPRSKTGSGQPGQTCIVPDRIHHHDALKGLAQLPDESVDLVVTDPPYNIASKNRLIVLGGKLMSTHEAWGAWDTYHPFDYDLLIQRVLSACYRVLKPGGSLYMFTAREDTSSQALYSGMRR